jgi:hypothetical protein
VIFEPPSTPPLLLFSTYLLHYTAFYILASNWLCNQPASVRKLNFVDKEGYHSGTSKN